MTKMREDDIEAVYAFVMTRQPARAATLANDLEFPFNIRTFVAGWKLLFLDRGVFQADPSKSPEWNHGAYLVEGLAHCGACHTPRNVLGAERQDAAYGGGESEGWIAPALNAASPAAVPWTAERLYTYLREGRDDLHGVAAGPMAPVVRNLAGVPDANVEAIAVYVTDISGAPSRGRQEQARRAIARASERARQQPTRAEPLSGGAQIYAGACAQCHGEAGRTPINPALNLALSTPVRAPESANVVRIIMDGIHPPEGAAGPLMPGFGQALTDAQIASLAAYLRAHFTDQPAWSNIEATVRRARRLKEGS
jgi:mono/diheme cytochrome c family protein